MQGSQADRLKKDNYELFAERLAKMKALIEQIGKAEGVDYKYYKNNLRYLNREKILAKLHEWGVEEIYREDVEALCSQAVPSPLRLCGKIIRM